MHSVQTCRPASQKGLFGCQISCETCEAADKAAATAAEKAYQLVKRSRKGLPVKTGTRAGRVTAGQTKLDLLKLSCKSLALAHRQTCWPCYRVPHFHTRFPLQRKHSDGSTPLVPCPYLAMGEKSWYVVHLKMGGTSGCSSTQFEPIGSQDGPLALNSAVTEMRTTLEYRDAFSSSARGKRERYLMI